MPELWNNPLSNPAGGGGMFGSLSNSFQNNPEMFAIVLDQLGKGIAPQNPAAGIGTMLGQSSLANKARNEQKADTKSFIDGLVKNAGGMSMAGLPGVTDIKTTLDKDGVPEYNMKFNPPAQQQSQLGNLGSKQ